jgi:hypothetical protein
MSGDNAICECDKTSQLIKLCKEREAIVQAKSSTSKLMNELLEECRKLDIQTSNAISKMRLKVREHQHFDKLEVSFEDGEANEIATEKLVGYNNLVLKLIF